MTRQSNAPADLSIGVGSLMQRAGEGNEMTGTEESQRTPEHRPSSRTEPFVIGIDVGSTTVKATVVDPESKKILWSDYLRHNTKQPECVLDFLVRIGNEYPLVQQDHIRTFITGSGG